MMNSESLPEELKDKEIVVFGNLEQLLSFHKTIFIDELEKCETSPELLADVFLKSVCCNLQKF